MPAKPLNVVFLGAFPYPQGMAGTKLIHRLALALNRCEGTEAQVVSLRQQAQSVALDGNHEGVPYRTILPNGLGWKLVTGLLALHRRTLETLRQSYRPDGLNVICRYGPPGFEDARVLRQARRVGYKIVCYLVEDYDVATGISSAWTHRVQNRLARCSLRLLPRLADGLLVISRPLLQKYTRLTGDHLPVHLCPVVAELDAFACDYPKLGHPVRLFYAGSFGTKDGVDNLLTAFEELIGRGHGVRLVLSGKGERTRMGQLRQQIERMPCKSLIEERGYLSDAAYLALLNAVDIPCMTRVDSLYAQAGFPFKLAEYLASGRPVIASRMNVLEEYLTDRVNAMLVKPGSAEEIVAAVEWLLAHPTEAVGIGREGRRAAERHFCHLEAGRRLKAFLEGLYDPSPRPKAVSQEPVGVDG